MVRVPLGGSMSVIIVHYCRPQSTVNLGYIKCIFKFLNNKFTFSYSFILYKPFNILIS